MLWICRFSERDVLLHGAWKRQDHEQGKSQEDGERSASWRKRESTSRLSAIPAPPKRAGFAYKNIDDVVEAAALAGISLPVAKLVPLGNVKG